MNIPLHPERGLDPHLTVCPRCGGDGNAIVIGDLRKAKMPNGQWIYASRGKTRQTEQDLEKAGHLKFQERLSWGEVRESDKIPDTEPCSKCQAELKEWDGIVAKGGVHFKCDECHQQGVIRPSGFSTAVRKEHGLMNGEPCGVQFTKCTEHGG